MALTQVQGGMLAGSTNTTTTIQSNGTTAITIDSSQNVGIGTATPARRLTVKGSTGIAAERDIDTDRMIVTFNDITNYANANGAGNYNNWTFTQSNNSGSNERMRIDSSGNVCLGTTNADPSGNSVNGFTFNASAPAVTGNRVGGPSFFIGRSSTTGTIVQFRYNGADQGTISTNGSTTAYNSSSDYRLKENIAPMTGALAKVAQLKPVTYTWKATGEAGEGFIAHELQEVVPDAVTGEKDEIDADGKPVYQGIDTSFLVATLTAAIQELNAKVEAQAAEIAALKAK